MNEPVSRWHDPACRPEADGTLCVLWLAPNEQRPDWPDYVTAWWVGGVWVDANSGYETWSEAEVALWHPIVLPQSLTSLKERHTQPLGIPADVVCGPTVFRYRGYGFCLNCGQKEDDHKCPGEVSPEVVAGNVLAWLDVKVRRPLGKPDLLSIPRERVLVEAMVRGVRVWYGDHLSCGGVETTKQQGSDEYKRGVEGDGTIPIRSDPPPDAACIWCGRKFTRQPTTCPACGGTVE